MIFGVTMTTISQQKAYAGLFYLKFAHMRHLGFYAGHFNVPRALWYAISGEHMGTSIVIGTNYA